jgi:hypothetical protein
MKRDADDTVVHCQGRLEQGFQQAITNDRRLHRLYIALGVLYASLAK